MNHIINRTTLLCVFLVLIVALCTNWNALSSASDEDESELIIGPLKGRSWKIFDDYPSDTGPATPFGVTTIAQHLIIPRFTKVRGGPRILPANIRNADGKWKTLDNLACFGSIQPVNATTILQGQAIENRKTWVMKSFSLKTFEENNEIILSEHPEAKYFHHTHTVRSTDGVLYAIAGIHQGAMGMNDYYELCTSKDDGKTWSTPVKILKGFVAHDDLPTVFKAVKDSIVFFGRKNRQGKLVVFADGKWDEMPLPDDGILLSNFQVSMGKLHLLYGIREDHNITMFSSFSKDLETWSTPVEIVSGLKPEDVLMQIPPTFLVRDNRLLATVADIHGDWTKNEYTARVFGSDNAGQNWFEIKTPDRWVKPPLFVFGSIYGDDIILVTLTGSFKKPTTELWAFTK